MRGGIWTPNAHPKEQASARIWRIIEIQWIYFSMLPPFPVFQSPPETFFFLWTLDTSQLCFQKVTTFQNPVNKQQDLQQQWYRFTWCIVQLDTLRLTFFHGRFQHSAHDLWMAVLPWNDGNPVGSGARSGARSEAKRTHALSGAGMFTYKYSFSYETWR